MASRLFHLAPAKLTATLTAALLAASLSACAQVAAAPDPIFAPAKSFYDGLRVSRLDLYGGYGYLHPVDSSIGGFTYLPINPGAVASVAGYFNHTFGLQAEGSFFPHGPNDCVYTAQAGPIVRHQRGRFVPFAHALFGAAKVGGPAFQPCTWGYGLTVGLGFDYILPGFDGHLAIRPIQADFEYSHVDYGPLVTPGNVTGGLGEIVAYRLSGGLVLRFGDLTPPPPHAALACTLEPAVVFPGDPIAATATARNLNPKKPVTYTWTTTGTPLQAHDATATIDTKAATAGTYTVTAHVTQGPKPFQSAACTATYTVRAFDPPTIACAANPAAVQPGDPSTITAHAISPQNRPLTYSYATSAGQIEGDTPTATLTTIGAAPGPITVTCIATDDLHQTARASAIVTVATPPTPTAPHATNLCAVTFDRDHKRPERVDNEAKACLDDIALALQRQADARLIITGNHAPDEPATAATNRALNVQHYLTTEKGIDPSRLTLRPGTTPTRTVQNTLVPRGATP